MEAQTLQNRERLAEIIRLDLFSGEVQGYLNDLTRKAARRFGLPVSLVSIILDHTQYFASHYGLDGHWLGESEGTPIEWSFCKHSVVEREDFIVENAPKDHRVKDNPLVQNDSLTCYAGTPLITSRGHAIGSLCVIGHNERAFSKEELADLRRMAEEVVRRLEERVQTHPCEVGR